MDTILQLIQQRKTLVALIGGGVLGLLLGLAIGWWWWPVEWTNSTPGNLRWDFQNDYIAWVAEQYAETGDLEWARSKLGIEYWKKGQLAEALEEVAAERGSEEAVRLRALAQALETTTPPSATEEAEGGGGLGSTAMVCGAALLVIAFVGGGAFLVSRLRKAQMAPEAERRARKARERAPAEAEAWGESGPPLSQFVTTYTLGDDHYDPSFSVELENGEFMGECGVGISETIGVGSPDKVTAFEVWLFDKNDIRTVTKVLMSDYAFHDEALGAKLAPKGEPVLAGPGLDVILETKTLRMRARIVEVDYGVGKLPANSFFERLTVDLAVWTVQGSGEAQSEDEAQVSVPAP
jgi:hypothetical protein